jgi:putative lipoic acid-binding regulatory protein
MARRTDLPTDPTELAAALAGFSPAERYEQLIDFPTDHGFKLIGPAGPDFTDAVRATLAAAGYPQVELTARVSGAGHYVALSATLAVATGADLVALYERLAAVPGVKYVL